MYNPFFNPVRQALLNYAPLAGNGLTFKSIRQYDYAFLSGEIVCSVTITEVDTSKSFIIPTFRCNNDAGTYANDLFCLVEFMDSTTVRLYRGFAGVSQWPVGSFIVYEFDTGIIDVTSAQQNMSGLALADVTVPSFETSKAMLFYSFRCAGNTQFLTYYLCSLKLIEHNTVRIQRASNNATYFPLFNLFLVRFS